MIKLFFITFFVAELIIAFAIIFKIYSFNKYINTLNNKVSESKELLASIFLDIRTFLELLNKGIYKCKEFIREKKEEYFIKIAKNIIIFFGFLSLKGKYKKTILAYQLGREIYQELKNI